jgi:apolipoprotein N-acyltransferase
MRHLWPWLAAILSGLLGAAALPPFDQTWLCWIALIPLTATILFSGADIKHRWLHDFALGYVAGLTFFWISFSWLTTVTALGWFVLQFYMAIYYGLWAAFCGLTRPRDQKEVPATDKWSEMLAQARPQPTSTSSPWLGSGHNLSVALTLASVWVTCEWIRGWLFSGFGWNGLGIALHATWPMIQIAEFTGVAGVTFAIAFCNVILTTTGRRIWQETRTRVMRPHYDLTLTMIGLVGIFTFGITAVQTRPPTHPLHLALVQSNVARAEKFDVRYKQKIFEKFERLSGIALGSAPNIELLVWPESALPAPVLQDQQSFDFVSRLAVTTGVDLLLGVIDEPVDGGAYNAALLIRPESREGQPGITSVQLYRKVHLVPFGEYVPLRHSFPLFARIAGDQVPEDFDAGSQFTLFELSNNRGRVAPLICFEDTIGELTRQFVIRGADVLANVTNDGWFLRSAGSQQHLANAVFRCVETRRPMLRAANTGVTCLVNQFGRVTQVLRDDQGSIFEEGTLVGDLELANNPTLTFYARYGEVFAKLCASVAVLVVVAKAIALLRTRIRRAKAKRA